MGEKTTIEIDNLRELKQHALDTNKTLKQLINEAIIEKINRERQLIKQGNFQTKAMPRTEENKNINQTTITELKNILSNAGLLQIVEKECDRHKVDLNNLSPDTVTPELKSDIHTAITLVFDDDTAEEIIQKIETILS